MIIVIKLIYNKTQISVLFELLQETENHLNEKIHIIKEVLEAISGQLHVL